MDFHRALFTTTGTTVKTHTRTNEWNALTKSRPTLAPLHLHLPVRAGHHKHEAMAARIVYYLDMNNCACFCHYTPGWVQFNIPLAVIATTGWQQPLSAQASSTPHSLRAPWAEVMPGSQARTPGSEQGYKIRSKFRGLLSRLCNNYINQTGWPLLLMFYKRGFFTFYCSVSWDYVTAVAHRQRGSAVSHFKCLMSM